jgi:hypothetical protein
MLILSRLPRFPRFLVLVLAVIHDPDHRRTSVRRNLDEIQSLALGRRQRFLDRQYPKLLTVRRDDTDRADTDLPIDAGSLLLVSRYGAAS